MYRVSAKVRWLPAACLLSLVGLVSVAEANPVYKVKDANGRTVFTDQYVKGAERVNLKPIARPNSRLSYIGNSDLSALTPISSSNNRSKSNATAATQAADQRVRLETKKTTNQHQLLVRNDWYAPVEIELALSNAKNIRGSTATQRVVIPARSSRVVTSLSPQNPAQAMRYQPQLRYVLGSPHAQHSLERYPLAWNGGPFRLTQGPRGRYSHYKPKGRYALDIAMPVGTPIVAARAGVVLETHNSQAGRGPNPAGNFVRILHNDGTMGVYLHLQQQSVRVAVGQRVAIGETIARSGNTGNSTGPHLHFVVQKNMGLAVESIPFDFNQPVDSVINNAVGGD